MQSANELYTLGEDVDFDQLNDQLAKARREVQPTEQIPNPGIDTRNISQNPSSPEKSPGKKRETWVDSHVETSIEKLSRLKVELQELKEELGDIVEKEKEIKIVNQETNMTLLKNVQSLQSQVANLHQHGGISKLLKNEGATNVEENHALLDLKKSLHYHKAEALLLKIQKLKKSGGKDANVTYELSINEPIEPVSQDALVTMEKRLTTLEDALKGSNSVDLLEEVQKIKGRVNKISQGNIDRMVGRLNSFSQELENFGQKRATSETSDPRLVKVEKLYEAYGKIQRVSEYLPGLVNRLDCVRIIHEESETIADKINNLKENQKKIQEGLGENDSRANNVEELFRNNLGRIEQNIKELQTQIEKLGAK